MDVANAIAAPATLIPAVPTAPFTSEAPRLPGRDRAELTLFRKRIGENTLAKVTRNQWSTFNLANSNGTEDVADRGAFESETKVVNVFVEDFSYDPNELVRIHRAIVVASLGHIPAVQVDWPAQIGAQVVVESFHAKAVADDGAALVPDPFELVEPRTQGSHPGLPGVFRYWQDPLLSHEIFKRRVCNELSPGVGSRPLRRVLTRKVVSRSGPAPGVADNCEELEVSTNFIRDIYIAIVKRFTEGYIPLQA